MNIKSALNWASQEFNTIHDSPQLDAELLLSHIIRKDRTYFYTWPENSISPGQLVQYQTIVAKRKSGIPIAYLLGNKEFWSLTLNVTSDTLIPRPETEHLVEQALVLIPETASWNIADLGTGTGAIALAIASERKHCNVIATDKSTNALTVAKKNAFENKINNVTFIQSNWFAALTEQQFNIIISNPPYVSAHDPLLSQGDVRFEPVSALQSGADGLDDIRLIIKDAFNYLLKDGWLILEHGFEQHQLVQDIFSNNNYQNISTVNDLSGNPRVTYGQLL